MNFALAKANRLKKKFNFNARDWRCETEGLAEGRRLVTAVAPRPAQPLIMWDRPLFAESQQVSMGAEEWLET